MKTLILAVALLALAGCATNQPYNPPEVGYVQDWAPLIRPEVESKNWHQGQLP